ncbi:MAG: HAMP domain-containing sensor histidine kinase [Myxococcota bacterium]|nr:HAMP domain-containing sensor histidine kinase [Myxococcota bacterium]
MSSTFARVLLFRHLAICASALMAYLLRQELTVGYAVLGVVAGSAIVNFGLYLMRLSERAEPFAVRASPAIGVSAWTALIAVTNGVASPFVAGLWLEVMLAGMVFRPLSVLFITAAAGVALIGQQLWLGIAGNVPVLALEVGFLVGMGGITWAYQIRSQRREVEYERQHVQLGERLGALEVELEDERALGRLGENVGRLAHGLKNSVHSLRGFVALIEPNVDEKSHAALGALRGAIDDLEALARLTLEENRAIDQARDRVRSGPNAVINRCVAEVRTTHPDVKWSVEIAPDLPRLPIGDEDLEEVLLILLRNAIEAMRGSGAAGLAVFKEEDRVRLRVSDEGDGLSPAQNEKIFRAGYTTKEEGSGYGLFLARRILSEHAGTLEAVSGTAVGATFDAVLPTREGQEGGGA